MSQSLYTYLFFFFLMIRRPPRSTLFPTRRSSDLDLHVVVAVVPSRDRHRLRAVAPERRRIDERRHARDRKSTRLNSSHTVISYAVFCLKKKKKKNTTNTKSDKIKKVKVNSYA